MCKILNHRTRVLAGVIAAVFAIAAGAADEEKTYRKAVEDAAFVEASEISNELVPITKDNPNLIWNEDKSKILVTTWKAQGAYERFLKPYDKTSDNPEYAVWVTSAPQVKNLCAEFTSEKPKISKDAVDLRLKQYLGLDPKWQYDVFVEMWVSPADLFRPCVDPQTDDKSCNPDFTEQPPKINNIADYRAFYRDLYFKSFRSSAGVPWTGLGYTYDWGNKKSEVGASEFIMKPLSPYEIKTVAPTLEYCRA